MDLASSHYGGKIVPFGGANYQETLLNLGFYGTSGPEFYVN